MNRSSRASLSAARLAGGIVPGAMRSRADRPLKNGRWYLAAPGTLTKIGWGDLSFADLTAIAADLHHDKGIFLALPEHPPGGQHLPSHEWGEPASGGSWCWYDRPDDPPGPTIAELAAGADYAVLDGEVLYVDHYGAANRPGAVWIKRGYRCTRTGRILSTGTVRLLTITPEDLAARLTQLVGDPDLRSTNRSPWR